MLASTSDNNPVFQLWFVWCVLVVLALFGNVSCEVQVGSTAPIATEPATVQPTKF
jgi:hypothetical protein